MDIGNPYRCALLEVTLDQVGTEIKEMAKWMQYEGQEEVKFRQSITILCTATVDRVIGLEEGFVSPVGKTIALLIRVYDETELEAMNLESGAKYLVYGMDYSDVKGDYFTNLVRSNYPDQFLELFGDVYTAEEQVDCFMTVYDHSAMPVVAAIDTRFEIRPDLRKYMQWEGNEIKAQYISVEEYGLLSAHIPELTPINYTTGSFIPENISDGNWLFYQYQPDPYGMPYSTAMLVVTLDEVSEPMELALRLAGGIIEVNDFDSVEAYLKYMESTPKLTEIQGYTLKLTGRVHQVVSLQEGFRDPTGMIIRMTVTLPTLEELEALKLEAGATYLVCGMDYVDTDWALRGFLATDKQRNPVYIDAFDLNKMEVLSEEEQERFRADNPVHPVYARYNGSLSLTKEEFEAAGAVRLTLESPNSIIRYEAIRDEDGTLTELRPITEKTVISLDGTENVVSLEEFAVRYEIPTIARLEGTVVDYLSSEAGGKWQDALEMMDINNHAFGVLGVEKVGYLADFARENSRLVDGREFTLEEQQSGSRVCVINEAVAAANGLTVGDTITLNYYQRDPSLPYQSDKPGLLTPSASFYFRTTPITESAEYTIVGLWQGQELWGDVAHNEYILNPNTVIVPKSSVITPIEIPNSVLFHTIILKNGALENFRTLAARAGYEDRFICHDQGYSTIAANFHNYDALGKQILMVGVSVYAIVLLLFLIFFPASLGKALWTMESLGADRTARFIHVLRHAGILLTSAAVLGGMIGFASWDMVLDRLQTSAESAIRLNLESEVLLLILAAQFVIAFGLSGCVGYWLSRPRGLGRRR